jgi:hypothetical protein
MMDNSYKLIDMNPDFSLESSGEYQEFIELHRRVTDLESSGEYQELTHHMTPVLLISTAVLQIKISSLTMVWSVLDAPLTSPFNLAHPPNHKLL